VELAKKLPQALKKQVIHPTARTFSAKDSSEKKKKLNEAPSLEGQLKP